MVPGRSVNEHHLKPKTYKGTETVTLHVVCHTKIHSVFTEQELYQHYHTIDRLRGHPEIAKFIRWIAKKDPEFRTRNEATREIRRARR
jgi:hypothetical protein